MHKQLALVTAFTMSLAGCARATATDTTQPRQDESPTTSGATIEIVGEGGFAALVSRQVIRHDDRYFLYTQRHICVDACAALDSASGTLSVAADESLFDAIIAQAPQSLKNDYGITPNGADMTSYTVRITLNGATKTITADNGTMPPPLRRIVDAVQETIAAARK